MKRHRRVKACVAEMNTSMELTDSEDKIGEPVEMIEATIFVYDIFLFMHFCPGTITTHAESINSDLQRGLDRRLRHIQH